MRSKRIKDLPFSSRPQEKLLSLGKENVTNAELIAILLGTGDRKRNAVKLGEKVLSTVSFQKLSTMAPQELRKVPGIGQTKTARILAAIELGERLYGAANLTKIIISNTKDAVTILKEYADKKQEYLIALYINARNELIQKEIIGMGTLNSIRIEPKEIFRPALSTPCASMIIAHNHPSGDPQPSDDDVRFTKRIFDAGEIMGIRLLDHLILTKTKYFSFREYKVEG